MTAARKIAILGSTGSIGCSTVDLIERDRARFDAVALAANANADLLIDQARRLLPGFVAVCDPVAYRSVKAALSDLPIEVAAGPEAVIEAARRDSDLVMAAIVGSAGLRSTLAAIERGATVGLANKETLVCAGALVMAAVARSGATLLPVDSEHSAIFQVFEADQRADIAKVVLTASGGPFWDAPFKDMKTVTPEQAVAHPNWSMGAKISVDSATMMNKGLELIEAHYLFDMPDEQLGVLVHPQSIVHGLVQYRDGAMLAQMGLPDMRTPIAYALAWPDRMAAPVAPLDLAAFGQLSFSAPDDGRFPALAVARAALRAGGSAPTILNAANEEAVALFLARQIGFLDIAAIVEESLVAFSGAEIADVDDVDALSAAVRERIIGQHRTAAAI